VNTFLRQPERRQNGLDEGQIKQWIPAICAGNEHYFQKLYEETCTEVYRTTRFLIIHQQDAEDVVSEVYLALWKSLHQYDPARPFRFWLHGLIMRKVQDWRRTSWRRLRILERKKALGTAYPHNDILQKEAEQDLFQLLTILSAKHREVIILRFYHDYTLEEIAALLHISLGTVKSRLHHALKKLRKKVENKSLQEAGENHGF